jgi:hypothetical protein
MADVWEFKAPIDSTMDYSDGTIVPHRNQVVLFNGVPIGEVEIHMHRRTGKDKVTDVSFGITTIVYGPAPGGA